MTLRIGDRLQRVGRPMPAGVEEVGHVEYMVLDVSPAFEDEGATRSGPPVEGSDPRAVAVAGNQVQLIKVRLVGRPVYAATGAPAEEVPLTEAAAEAPAEAAEGEPTGMDAEAEQKDALAEPEPALAEAGAESPANVTEGDLTTASEPPAATVEEIAETAEAAETAAAEAPAEAGEQPRPW